MTRKIARRAGRMGRYAMHELWVSLEVTGALWFPAGDALATVARIRQDDALWHARRAHETDMRDLSKIAGK